MPLSLPPKIGTQLHTRLKNSANSKKVETHNDTPKLFDYRQRPLTKFQAFILFYALHQRSENHAPFEYSDRLNSARTSSPSAA